MDNVAKWKTVLWSDESKFEVLFGKLGRHVIRTKEDKDNPSCYQRSVQKPASLMYGVAWVRVAWAAYTSGKAPSMLKGISKFSNNICFHPDVVSFREDLAFSNMTMPDHILHQIQHHGCVEEGSGYWNGQPAGPDLSPIENIWRIIKRKMRQRRPKTVEQLEACIRQEWDNIPIPKLEQLVSSVPRCFADCYKKKRGCPQW